MWKVIGATMLGSSHAKSGVVCQDKISHAVSEDVICICLSDGAGSCSYSDIGAQIACETTVEYIANNFDAIVKFTASEFQQAVIHRIRTRLGMRASKIGCKKDDMSSTLLFVALKNDMFIVGHLGDGVIGAIYDKNLRLISAPENGECVNSTYFTTTADYKSHFRLIKGKIGNIDSFFLMSDGAADALYNKKDKYFSRVLISFAEWIDSHSTAEVNNAILANMTNLFPMVTSDDCSIIMAHRTNADTNE